MTSLSADADHLAQAKSAILSLQSQLLAKSRELENAVSGAAAESRSAAQKVEELSGRLSRRDRTIGELGSRLRDAQRRLTAAEERASGSEMELGTLQAEFKAAKAELRNLYGAKVQLDDLKQTLGERDAEIEELQRAAADAAAAAVKDHKASQVARGVLEAKLDRTKRNLTEMTAQRAELDFRLEIALKENHALATKGYNKGVKELEAALAVRDAEAGALRERLAAADAAAAQAQADEQSRVAEAATAVRGLAAELADARRAAEQRSAEAETLRRELASATEAAAAEADALRRKLAAATEALSAAEERIAVLSATGAARMHALAVRAGTGAAAGADPAAVARLQHKITELEKSNAELASSYERMLTEQARAANLQHDLEVCQAALARACSAEADLSTQVKSLGQELAQKSIQTAPQVSTIIDSSASDILNTIRVFQADS